jgi:hypothetical protein
METVDSINIPQGYQMLVTNMLQPNLTEYLYGPCMVHLEDPWQEFGGIEQMRILDQDDYIVIRASDGTKRRMDGAAVYKKAYGETIVDGGQSVQCLQNHYMIIYDQNDTHMPVKHVRGPCKYYPKPFQTVVTNTENGLQYFPCIEVTTNRAVHLMKANGLVVLLNVPQFYMLEVGEKVLETPERTVLLMTQFCILKSPDGKIFVMSGRDPESRSFHIQPYCRFVTWMCDGERKHILSTLPSFLSHSFEVFTRDNVNMKLGIRINYEIKNVDTFAANPIEFFSYLRNHAQNVLLDRFAGHTLREFMASEGGLAKSSVTDCNKYFMSFGIAVLDIQILEYVCTNPQTQKLLTTDIHTNVTKNNELKAMINDIDIQEQANKVEMKRKDLEVDMIVKDNDVALQKKELENNIRLKEMIIEIAEEHKRRILLEVKRENDLVEAEFEGRAKGHELKEFLLGVDPELSADQKIAIWKKQCEQLQTEHLYKKVDGVALYPSDVGVQMYSIDGDGAEAVHTKAVAKDVAILKGLGALN